MTPEDIDRMHAAALKRGWDPERLNALRKAALEEAGDWEYAARWATRQQNLAEYYADLRGDPPPSRY
ncbi:hypothetical protein [Streptosporangium sp. NPDC087985]|uniref:hypothetical protein n=1 Tax=Streptosporangium sp. NPDC087985 TaxID=3366196 RepID=UPI0038222E3A